MKDIRFNSALLLEIRKRPTADRREIGKCLAEAQRVIGQPHLHKGIGMRKLRDDYFEIRVGGLRQRLVFENTKDALVFELIGDHDDVKRFLKSL